MIYKTLISISTKIDAGETFPIYKDGTNKIGTATFTQKEGDDFVFDLLPLNNNKLNSYDLKPTIDSDSFVLVEFRAVAKS
jgi:hypothetical protein